MEFIELAELCDKGSSNLAQKDLVFDSGIYPVYGFHLQLLNQNDQE